MSFNYFLPYFSLLSILLLTKPFSPSPPHNLMFYLCVTH